MHQESHIIQKPIPLIIQHVKTKLIVHAKPKRAWMGKKCPQGFWRQLGTRKWERYQDRWKPFLQPSRSFISPPGRCEASENLRVTTRSFPDRKNERILTTTIIPFKSPYQGDLSVHLSGQHLQKEHHSTQGYIGPLAGLYHVLQGLSKRCLKKAIYDT